MNEIWKPNVTVAAIVQRDGKFLLVEEHTDLGLRLNQPAGHLDEGESLVAAAIRETLEETGWEFTPQHLTGIYRWRRSDADITYLRFAFSGSLGAQSDRPLDVGIVGTVWLSPEQLRSSTHRHRSPLVLRCVEDFLRGAAYPLDLLVEPGREN
ncbi:MAG: NUDIX hydrolase [Burkholderiales bacterium]